MCIPVPVPVPVPTRYIVSILFFLFLEKRYQTKVTYCTVYLYRNNLRESIKTIKNLSQSRTKVIALAPAKYPGSETLVSGAGPLM